MRRWGGGSVIPTLEMNRESQKGPAVCPRPPAWWPHPCLPIEPSQRPGGVNFLLCCFVSGTLPSVCCGGKVWVCGQLGLGYGHPCMAIFLPAQASGGPLQNSILVAFDLCESCLPKMR